MGKVGFELGLLAVLLALVIVSGCTDQKSSRNVVDVNDSGSGTPKDTASDTDTGTTDTVDITKPTGCAAFELIADKDNCYYEKAVDTLNPEQCKEILNSETKDSCYFELAKKSYENRELCFKIKDSDSQDSCYYSIATGFNYSKFCNRIGNEVTMLKCMQELYPNCYSFLSTEDTNRCLSIRTSNYSICGGNTDCLLSYAKELSDLSACSQIEKKGEKSACTSIVMKTDYCSSLSDFDRDSCYYYLGVYTSNPRDCDNINPRQKIYEQCFTRVAVDSKNMSICKNLKDYEKQNTCYYSYALNYSDYVACQNLSTRIERIPCLQKVAYATNNPAICNNIDANVGEQTTCYSNIIFGDRPYTVEQCAQLTLTTWKNKCLSTLAFRNKDASACEFIEQADEKESCLRNAE